MNKEQICNEWRKNPLVNPETKRPIKQDGPKYKELKRLCTPAAAAAAAQGKVVAVAAAAADSDICKEWLANKGVNPRTKARIKIGGPKYKELEKECSGVRLAKEDKEDVVVQPKTLKELRERAKQLNILGYSKMTKENLIKRIAEKEKPKKGALRVQALSFSPIKGPEPTIGLVPPPKIVIPPPPKIVIPPAPPAVQVVKINNIDLTNYLFNLVMSKQITLDPCLLAHKFAIAGVVEPVLIPKGGKSDSIISQLNITLNDGKVLRAFLKIWFSKTRFNEITSMDYEKDVYIYITENIIKRVQSPNFIPILAAAECIPRTVKIGGIDAWTELGKVSGGMTLIPPLYVNNPNSRIGAFITASSPNIRGSLHEFLVKTKLPVEERSSIIFQMIHAVYCLTLHKISHSDLHFHNVLVEELKDPICFRYIVGRNEVTFRTKCIVKIFDFDNAHVDALGLNPDSKNLALTLDPRKFREERDLYQVLCGFLAYPDLQELIYEILPNRELTYSKMTHQQDKIVRIKISSRSGAKIINEPQRSIQDIYLMATEKLKSFLTATEFADLRRVYPKIDMMSEIFFKLMSNQIVIIPGWLCAMKDILNKDNYYPIDRYFTDVALFNRLTRHLDKGGVPDGTFRI